MPHYEEFKQVPTVEDNQLTLKKGLKRDEEEEGQSLSGLAIKAVLSLLVIYIGWRYLGKGRKV